MGGWEGGEVVGRLGGRRSGWEENSWEEIKGAPVSTRAALTIFFCSFGSTGTNVGCSMRTCIMNHTRSQLFIPLSRRLNTSPRLIGGWDPRLIGGWDPRLIGGWDPRLIGGWDPRLIGGVYYAHHVHILSELVRVAQLYDGLAKGEKSREPWGVRECLRVESGEWGEGSAERGVGSEELGVGSEE